MKNQRGIRHALRHACDAMYQDADFQTFANKFRGTRNVMKHAYERLPRAYDFVSWTLKRAVYGMEYCGAAFKMVWERMPVLMQVSCIVLALTLVMRSLPSGVRNKMMDAAETQVAMLAKAMHYMITLQGRPEFGPHALNFDMMQGNIVNHM